MLILESANADYYAGRASILIEPSIAISYAGRFWLFLDGAFDDGVLDLAQEEIAPRFFWSALGAYLTEAEVSLYDGSEETGGYLSAMAIGSIDAVEINRPSR